MLSDNLKKVREIKGISKAQLARAIGVPYTTYNGYETQGKQPKLDILKKIANILEVDLNELLYSESELIKLETAEREREAINKYYTEKYGQDWEVEVYGLNNNETGYNEDLDDINSNVELIINNWVFTKDKTPNEIAEEIKNLPPHWAKMLADYIRSKKDNNN